MDLPNKTSFILYKSYYEILQDLPDDQIGMLFRAILAYQAVREVPELPPGLQIVFNFIKNQFDLDELKYEKYIAKQSANGKKGGRPKLVKDNPEEQKNNPMVFEKTQKSHNDNDNDNVNDNDNLSLLNEREERLLREERESSSDTEFRETISKEDKKLLETYVKRNKLANKNVRAYVRKIISNGDYCEIIAQERAREERKTKSPPTNITEFDLRSVNDKTSAFKVLLPYCDVLEELPSELEKVAKEYNLDNYEKLAKYSYELSLQKKQRKK